jgi:hypothetical protein
MASVWEATLREKSLTSITLLGAGIWVTAILLLVCNHTLYQLLEGYWGPFSRAKWRELMRQRFVSERDALRTRYNELRILGEGKAPDAESDYYARLWDFYVRFPYREDLVLPTRFGNVVRGFETYPLKVYGVDSIRAWLRLAGVVPKGMQSLVDNARAEVDFFVNVWLLSILFAVAASGRFVLWLVTSWPVSGVGNVQWLYPASVVLAVGAAWWSYEGAIARARPWGELIKSAFDLYLPALAKQLGYSLPDKRVDRERFWGAVTAMFLQLTPVEPEVWPRAAGEGGSHAVDKGEVVRPGVQRDEETDGDDGDDG